MQDLNIILNGIENRIKQLIEKLENLNKENKQLLEENLELKQQLSEHNDQATLFAGSQKDDKEAKMKQFRGEIDTYIKEIDKCIDVVKSM